ncbi:MAG: hypothetical protein KA054_02935 [Candidatus Moranbacteria bacterium]|nr:hypothetical protein [Candidatus Moranbacteria bacterium]
MNIHDHNEHFSHIQVEGGPFSPNLAYLQKRGHGTLEEYLNACFLAGDDTALESFTIPVTDSQLNILEITITSVSERRLTGFWKNPFCNQPCEKKTWAHPCLTTGDYVTNCDMFCAGSSVDDDDEDDGTLNLNQQLLCAIDRKGELFSCGILRMILHQHNRPAGTVMVSIELTIGCGRKHQSIFVIQCHDGLTVSLA